jgi:hypothetical protein
MMHDRDSWDELLVSVMQSRPEHVPALDLAAVAMERAGLSHQRLAHLARLARWTRITSAVAMILVTLILAAGYLLWPTSTTTASTTSTTSSMDLATLGIVAFLGSVTLLTFVAVFTPERPTFRLSIA